MGSLLYRPVLYYRRFKLRGAFTDFTQALDQYSVDRESFDHTVKIIHSPLHCIQRREVQRLTELPPLSELIACWCPILQLRMIEY
jgi:hypothetical protein